MRRRHFVTAAGTSLAAYALPAWAQQQASAGTRLLILLELRGGNDGLNTVVPTDGRYHDLRPRLALRDDAVVAFERGLLLRLRFELDHHVNLRPVRLYPGVPTPLAGKTPDDIDMVVVREGTEGPYAGSGGFLRKGTPHEVQRPA